MIDYRGLAALIIAASLGVSPIVVVVALALTGRTLTDVGGEVMIAINAAMAAVLAAFMASRDAGK